MASSAYEVEIRFRVDNEEAAYVLLPFLAESLRAPTTWSTDILGRQLYAAGELLRIGRVSTPDGVPLPLVGLGDIEELSQCGYNDLPSVASSIDPPLAVGDTPAIPDVGGVLPPDSPLTTIVLAVLMLVALPVAGLLKMKNNQPKG